MLVDKKSTLFCLVVIFSEKKEAKIQPYIYKITYTFVALPQRWCVYTFLSQYTSCYRAYMLSTEALEVFFFSLTS